jgi:hypothetical protein
MGKQSKRKAVSKKEHKERQEERRARVLREGSTRNDNDDADDEYRVEEIMAWDRVWFRDEHWLDSWQRGVVHKVVTDQLEPGISRYLVQRTEDQDGKDLITVTTNGRTITGSDESQKK